MQDLAESNNGEVFVDGEWQKLSDKLEALNAPIVSHQNERMEGWINLKALFFVSIGSFYLGLIGLVTGKTHIATEAMFGSALAIHAAVMYACHKKGCLPWLVSVPSWMS